MLLIKYCFDIHTLPFDHNLRSDVWWLRPATNIKTKVKFRIKFIIKFNVHCVKIRI